MGHSVHPLSYRLPLQRGWMRLLPPLSPPYPFPFETHLERQLGPLFPLVLFGAPSLFGGGSTPRLHVPLSLPPLSLLFRFLIRLNRLRNFPLPPLHLPFLRTHSARLLAHLLVLSSPPSHRPLFHPLLLDRFASFPPSLFGRLLTLHLRRSRLSLNRLVRTYLSNPLGLGGVALEGRGRFNRSQRAGRFRHRWGSTPFSSQEAPLLYGIHRIHLKYGSCSVRIWINRSSPRP